MFPTGERSDLSQNEPLPLNEETRELLRGGARLVNLGGSEAEGALHAVPTAMLLLQEICQRLRAGSLRLGEVDSRLDALRNEAKFAEARGTLDAALAAESVPHYQEQLEIRLDYLTTFESIFRTGQVQKDFHPWGQLRALALRVEQGFPLVVDDELRVFLRTVAPTVAMRESEAGELLETVGGAETLVMAMVKLVKEGRQRVAQALQQAIRLQEGGDIEMVEENLASLEERPSHDE
ncbi:MAG: DUF2379 family protein [Cystobacter sp.]